MNIKTKFEIQALKTNGKDTFFLTLSAGIVLAAHGNRTKISPRLRHKPMTMTLAVSYWHWLSAGLKVRNFLSVTFNIKLWTKNRKNTNNQHFSDFCIDIFFYICMIIHLIIRI
jgi:hypothetical protein